MQPTCCWRISSNTTSAACSPGCDNPGINPSLWTLKIEIGFYLIVPLIFVADTPLGLADTRRDLRASVVYSIVTLYMGDVRLARQLPGQMQFFVVGMALYLYGRAAPRPPLGQRRDRGSDFCAVVHRDSQFRPASVRLVVAAFVFSFALCTPVVRLRSDMSYSVYLVHGPLMQTLLLIGVFHDNLLYPGRRRLRCTVHRL